MSLKGDRFQAEAFGVNIQVFVCDKEEIVLFGRAKTSQTGEDDTLFLLEYFLHFHEEIQKEAACLLLVDAVTAGVKFYKTIVFCVLPLAEREPPVGRINGVSPITKRSRDRFCNEGSYTRKGYFISVKNKLLDHFRQEVDIHIAANLDKGSKNLLKKVWRYNKLLYLCNPKTKVRD